MISVKFQSKYPSYRVVVKPSKYLLNAYGDKVFEQGIRVEFINGFFSTDDNEIVEGLKKNQFYGIDFWSVDEPAIPNEAGVKSQNEVVASKETLLTDCPVCGKTFKTTFALKAHIRLAHPDK